MALHRKFCDIFCHYGLVRFDDAFGLLRILCSLADIRFWDSSCGADRIHRYIYIYICTYFNYVADEKRKTEEDKTYHTTLDFHEDQTDCYERDEKNRERYEYRKVTTSVNTACISKMEEMPYIKTIGVVYQVRRLILKDTDGNNVTPSLKTFLAEGSARQPKPQAGDGMADAVQRTGILSNREMTAQEAGKIKKEHWRIENGLHHVLDDAFREDQSPAKGSRNNLALIRKIAYNIIRYALMTSHENAVS